MARSSNLRRGSLTLVVASMLLGGCVLRDMGTRLMLRDPNVDQLTKEAIGVNSADGVTYSNKRWRDVIFHWTATLRSGVQYDCENTGRGPVCSRR